MNYDLSSDSPVAPYLVSGVFAGYYLAGNKKPSITEYHYDEIVHHNHEAIFFSQDVNPLNNRLIFGGGIRLSRFVFDVRYEYDLTDITQKAATQKLAEQ